jgi:hypothetical protein
MEMVMSNWSTRGEHRPEAERYWAYVTQAGRGQDGEVLPEFTPGTVMDKDFGLTLFRYADGWKQTHAASTSAVAGVYPVVRLMDHGTYHTEFGQYDGAKIRYCPTMPVAADGTVDAWLDADHETRRKDSKIRVFAAKIQKA